MAVGLVTTYVTGDGSRTHVADGEKVEPERLKSWYPSYWKTLCGVTGDVEMPYPTERRPLCKRCEKARELRDRDLRRALGGAL